MINPNPHKFMGNTLFSLTQNNPDLIYITQTKFLSPP